MTNFERFQSMSKDEFIKFLLQLDVSRQISDSLYCKVCEHRIPGTHGCGLPDNAKLPCRDVSDEEAVRLWLDREFK